MTGWGGGNPNAAEASPGSYEMPVYQCPKCGDDVQHLPAHMRACTGTDHREGQHE